MRIVLITGANSGFGRLTALEFAQRGDTVYASMRNMAHGEALQAEARARGVSLQPCHLDVTVPDSIDSTVQTIVEREGRIDVLVNNAGIASFGPVEDYADDEIEELFDTNVLGAVRTVRAVVPSMRKQGRGRIINVSSTSGRWSWPFMGMYAASKHALEAISVALRYELHGFGIRVSIVQPGNFATGIGHRMHIARRYQSGSASAEYRRIADELLVAQQLEHAATGIGDPIEVARRIVEIAGVEHPAYRYLVGEDAAALDELSEPELDEKRRAQLGLKNFF